MTDRLLNFKIIDYNQNGYVILISQNNISSTISYSPSIKKIVFIDNTELTPYIEQNIVFLERMLHNKKESTFYKGFELKFTFPKIKPSDSYFDYRNKIIVYDRRDGKDDLYQIKESKQIPEIFTDGSYNQYKDTGAIACLVKETKNDTKLLSHIYQNTSNNLLELIAVIKGLSYLKEHDSIRVVTDSRYVIKGLISWIPVWKVNNWYTVNGDRVKNIDYWKKLDSITQNKYIELKWVKAHSNHKENTYCDQLSKLISK